MSSDASASAPPAPWLFLRVWLGLGLQSFGGGAATLTLIRRAAVERYGWLSEADFTRDWALVQVAPGINLLALIILIGRRTLGAKGIALALLGLLLPSVAVTVLLTACYARVRGLEAVQAALHGVIPATVGLGMLTAMQMARPLLTAGYREGKGGLLISVLLLVGSGVAALWLRWPVMLVLFAAGGMGAFVLRPRREAPTETPTP